MKQLNVTVPHQARPKKTAERRKRLRSLNSTMTILNNLIASFCLTNCVSAAFSASLIHECTGWFSGEDWDHEASLSAVRKSSDSFFYLLAIAFLLFRSRRTEQSHGPPSNFVLCRYISLLHASKSQYENIYLHPLVYASCNQRLHSCIRTWLPIPFGCSSRSCLRIFLCLAPSPSLRDRLRQYPRLVSSCTVDVLEPWPSEALVAVGCLLISSL